MEQSFLVNNECCTLKWWKWMVCVCVCVCVCRVFTMIPSTTFWPSFHIILYLSFELLTHTLTNTVLRFLHNKHTHFFLQANKKRTHRPTMFIYSYLKWFMRMFEGKCNLYKRCVYTHSDFITITIAICFAHISTMNLFNLLTMDVIFFLLTAHSIHVFFQISYPFIFHCVNFKGFAFVAVFIFVGHKFSSVSRPSINHWINFPC